MIPPEPSRRRAFRLPTARRALVPLALALLALLLAGTAAAAPAAPPRVLVLNSYHPGFKWTDDIVAGIESVMGRDVDLRFEYMDTRRIFSGEYLAALYQTYRVEFRDHRFDAIVVSDDPALDFVLDHRDELFPGAPVVFCGINDFSDARLRGQQGFTGVVEDVDVPSTLEIARRLHPTARRVIAVVNTNATGIANRRLVERAAARLRGRLEVEIVADPELEGFVSRLAALPKGEAFVLLAGRFRTRAGPDVPLAESTPRLAATGVPIYSLWEFYLGHGIVGGRLTNGTFQGRTAGALARRVLAGERDVPIVRESPNEFMFDWRELARQGIALDRLPAGSRIVNRPESFYARYHSAIWVAVVITLSYSAIVLLLWRNIVQKNRVQAALREHERNLETRIAERTRELNEANRLVTDALAVSEASLAKVKQLEGIIPICSYCKKIRDDQESWQQLEAYIRVHTNAQFTHGICPDCARTHFPDDGE